MRIAALASPRRNAARTRAIATSLSLAVAFAVAAVAAAPPASVTAGTRTSDTLVSGGIERTYRTYVPGSLRRGERPALVIVLHGFGGSGAQAERAYGWDAQAERDRFVVAYPDGLRRAWNDAALDRQPKADDVAFLVRLIDHLSATHRVDARRVFVAGMSNGGFMAERLACDASDRIAAIGAVAASRRADCTPSAPVSVMHVHGAADPLVAYTGAAGGPVGPYPAIPALVAEWRTADGCEESPAVRVSGVVRRETARSCADGTAVVLVTIATGVHEWPGGTRAATPASTFATTRELWAFFAAHPRR